MINSSQPSAFKSLLTYLWTHSDHKLRFVGAFVCLGLAKLVTLCVPFLFKNIINQLNVPSPTLGTMIVLFIFSYGLARTVNSLFSEASELLFIRVTQAALRESALRVFNHLHQLSLSYHLSRETGGLSRIIERGTKAIETFMRFMSVIILPAGIEVICVTAIFCYLYEWSYGFITFLTLFLYIVFSLLLTQWRLKYIRQLNETENNASTQAIDSLLNYETVKYFNNEAFESKRYDKHLHIYEDASVKSRQALSYLNIGQALIIALNMIGVLYLAAKQWVAGQLNAGDFVALNTFLMQAYLPLGNLGFAYREIKVALVNMESLYHLLDIQEKVTDIPNAQDLAVTGGEVIFDNVSFSYNPNRPILKNISFTVKPGQTLAVVGSSGSGKTTIGRLLFRFYDPNEGRILIDGQNIKETSQASVRQAIGVVPQDTVLFNQTIKYNIAYGCPDATEEAIIQAAKYAQIHDFISHLPDQYDTLVGERGLKLSGGEKQRIAIARVFLKKPKLFLLDEATSALDSHTESSIQKNLRHLCKHHSTVVIAHRLSTIVEADQILVLDQGEIKEIGNHQELYAKKGYYYKLWHTQSDDETEVK